MALEDDVRDAAERAAAFAAPDEHVAAVLAAEASPGGRVYVCSFESDTGRSWLALDADGEALTNRAFVREAVSLLALCEIAEEAAEEAAETEVVHPRLATPAYLDNIGTPDVAGSMHAVDALLQDVESAYKRELT
jgi:hypothetical protein